MTPDLIPTITREIEMRIRIGQMKPGDIRSIVELVVQIASEEPEDVKIREARRWYL